MHLTSQHSPSKGLIDFVRALTLAIIVAIMKDRSKHDTAVPVHKNIRKLTNQEPVNECRQHGAEFMVEDQHTGDSICTKCGRIVCERMMCEEAEWRNFGDDSTAEKWKRSRIGAAANPLLGDEANLGTSILREGGADGSNYAKIVRSHYKRRSVDNAIKRAFDAIATTASRIHLPDAVVFHAQELYSSAYRKLQYKGNVQVVDAKVPASIYLACRLDECPRSSKEIARISEISLRELRSAIKTLVNTLSIVLPNVDTNKMIERFVSQLDLTPNEIKEIRRKVQKISAQTRDKLKTDNKLPETIIGGQIMKALIEDNPKALKKEIQAKIGLALGISGGTVARSSQMMSKIVQTS